MFLNPTKTTNFELFKKRDQNSGMFYKSLENSVGIGEIARYEQLLLFSTVFFRPVQQTRKKQVFLGGRLTLNKAKILSLGKTVKHYFVRSLLLQKVFK